MFLRIDWSIRTYVYVVASDGCAKEVRMTIGVVRSSHLERLDIMILMRFTRPSFACPGLSLAD